MEFDLREWQLFEITMLDEVDRICKKYNLRYYLSSGTLLGAVRHKGFIPWDDDIDVDMPIEDYKKFCKVAQKEFGDRFFFQTYKTDKEYHGLWAMVRANGTTSLPVSSANWNIHWGAHIDIFPMIGLYDNKILRKIQYKLFGLNKTLLEKYYIKSGACGDYIPSKKIQMLHKLPTSVLHFWVDVNNMFLNKKFFNSERGSTTWNNLKYRRRSENYKQSLELDFEGCKYCVPYKYHEQLTLIYGDYMTPPPESERGGHELTHGRIIKDLTKDYLEYQNAIKNDKSLNV